MDEWWHPNVYYGPGNVVVENGDKWREGSYDAVIKTSEETDKAIISAFLIMKHCRPIMLFCSIIVHMQLAPC